MEKLLIILILLVTFSCSESGPNTYTSGTMTDSVNGDAQVLLNYRINTNAVSHHSSLAFLNQLKATDFQQLPASWPETRIDDVTSAFKYLHRQPNSGIKSVSAITDHNVTTLTFIDMIDESFHVAVDRELNQLNWVNDQGLNVELKKKSEGLWEINVDGEELSWNSLNSEVCYLSMCKLIVYGNQ